MTNTALELIKESIAHIMKARKIPTDQEYKRFIFPCPHKKKEQAIYSHALPVSVRRNLAWPLTHTKGKPLYTKEGKPATENRLGVN